MKTEVGSADCAPLNSSSWSELPQSRLFLKCESFRTQRELGHEKRTALHDHSHIRSFTIHHSIPIEVAIEPDGFRAKWLADVGRKAATTHRLARERPAQVSLSALAGNSAAVVGFGGDFV